VCVPKVGVDFRSRDESTHAPSQRAPTIPTHSLQPFDTPKLSRSPSIRIKRPYCTTTPAFYPALLIRVFSFSHSPLYTRCTHHSGLLQACFLSSTSNNSSSTPPHRLAGVEANTRVARSLQAHLRHSFSGLIASTSRTATRPPANCSKQPINQSSTRPSSLNLDHNSQHTPCLRKRMSNLTLGCQRG
jgi:hypothetical protein